MNDSPVLNDSHLFCLTRLAPGRDPRRQVAVEAPDDTFAHFGICRGSTVSLRQQGMAHMVSQLRRVAAKTPRPNPARVR